MYEILKRLFDIVFSAIGLLILSPLLLIIALKIKSESEGPVFYRAYRVGKDRKLFQIFKFRSMVVNADKIGGPSTSDKDSRLTASGQFLRRYKLDELPQLINVLTGKMSFVGPRPEIASEVERYKPEWGIVFDVRPGITDLASIEFRNEGEIIANSGIKDAHEAYRRLIQPRKLELQQEYVRQRSFLLDLEIILKTILSIFRSENNALARTCIENS